MDTDDAEDMCSPLPDPNQISGGNPLPESDEMDLEDSMTNCSKRKAREEACDVLKKLLKADSTFAGFQRPIFHDVAKAWSSGRSSDKFMDTASFRRGNIIIFMLEQGRMREGVSKK